MVTGSLGSAVGFLLIGPAPFLDFVLPERWVPWTNEMTNDLISLLSKITYPSNFICGIPTLRAAIFNFSYLLDNSNCNYVPLF